MSNKGLSPLGAVAAGAVAGAVGVLAMDLVWWTRARMDGSDQSFVDYEFSTGSTSDYDEAATPAEVGRRVAEGVFDGDVPPESAGPMNDIVHWATGLGYGAVHGLVFGSADQPKVTHGLATGLGAFANSYTMLPLMGLYQPLWEYDAKTIYKDLSAHLAYGLATGTTFRLLSAIATGNGAPAEEPADV